MTQRLQAPVIIHITLRFECKSLFPFEILIAIVNKTVVVVVVVVLLLPFFPSFSCLDSVIHDGIVVVVVVDAFGRRRRCSFCHLPAFISLLILFLRKDVFSNIYI